MCVKMMDASYDSGVKKALVVLAIQETLLEISKEMFEMVYERLQRDYKCYISDCYNHPEYLNRILKDLFGESHTAIINLIKAQLEKHSSNKGLSQFIDLVGR